MIFSTPFIWRMRVVVIRVFCTCTDMQYRYLANLHTKVRKKNDICKKKVHFFTFLPINSNKICKFRFFFVFLQSVSRKMANGEVSYS